MSVLAWHFTAGMALRDGQVLEAGRTYRLPEGARLIMCVMGYHGSRRLTDALQYAPSSMLSRTEHGGEIVEDEDKLVSTERTVLWVYDATRLLQDFAVVCAERALERERAAGREPDVRSWEAVRVARGVLAGEMEVSAAWSADRAALSAVDAARSAADAAWSAGNAARSGADAVESAAYVARSAAYVARSAAYVARSAARAVERDWQESWLLAELAKRTGREV